jgi:hypothetical protein
MAKRLAHFAPGPVHLQAAIWEMKSVSENALCVIRAVIMPAWKQ